MREKNVMIEMREKSVMSSIPRRVDKTFKGRNTTPKAVCSHTFHIVAVDFAFDALVPCYGGQTTLLAHWAAPLTKK